MAGHLLVSACGFVAAAVGASASAAAFAAYVASSADED